MKELSIFDPIEVRDVINDLRDHKILSLRELAKYLGVCVTTADYLLHPEEPHRFSFKMKRRIIDVLNKWIKEKRKINE